MDRPYYVPGDIVHGTVHVLLEKPGTINRLLVTLYGCETAHVPAQKTVAEETNEMLNVGHTLCENQIFESGDASFPFQFQLPASALPTYTGKYAEVFWELSATLEHSWGTNWKDKIYLVVYTVNNEKQAPVAFVGSENSSKLQMDLYSQVFEPGEIIDGKLTLLAGDKLRSAKVQLVISEFAHVNAGFRHEYAEADNSKVCTSIDPVQIEELIKGPVSFRLVIPSDAPTSYAGRWSEVHWTIELLLDHHRFSLASKFPAPITIAIKKFTDTPKLIPDENSQNPIRLSSSGT